MQQISTEYLESHITETQSRGMKCLCPACGSKNLWYTPDNGRAHCFECLTNYKTTEVDYGYEPPTPHPNIEGFRRYYEAVSKTYHGCIEKEHEEYLKSRGLDERAIEEFELGFCPDQTLALYQDPIAIESGVVRRDKKPILGSRITFSYKGEGKTTDIRGRIFRGDAMKYKGLFSSSIRRGAIYPFNWDKAVLKAAVQKLLIITEGEMKAILADLHGFPCVALPGMTNFRPCPVPADWRTVILFDNSRNPLDRMRIDRAIERVYTRLPKSLIATLPLEKAEKQDIDSFLLGRGDRAGWLRRIVDNALPFSDYMKLRRF